jgi:hypothetical protein
MERAIIVADPQPYDYTAKDGDHIIGRVYRHHSTGWSSR